MTDLFPSPTLPSCAACQCLLGVCGGSWCCQALPEVIPAPLIGGQFDHRRAYPEDRGLRFEPDWDAPEAVLVAVVATQTG